MIFASIVSSLMLLGSAAVPPMAAERPTPEAQEREPAPTERSPSQDDTNGEDEESPAVATSEADDSASDDVANEVDERQAMNAPEKSDALDDTSATGAANGEGKSMEVLPVKGDDLRDGIGRAPFASERKASTATGPEIETKRKHIALVIGNASYREGMALHSPPRDADAMATVLTHNLRFDAVKTVKNASREAMIDALREVRTEAADANIVVYYSGHAVQIDGRNYLIPTDSPGWASAEDVRVSSLSLEHVLSMLREANLRIVILDACRTNPLGLGTKGQNFEPGLAPVRLSGLSGTLIAFSSAPGTVAYDGGVGKLSPYTESLIAQLAEPHRSVHDVFIETRRVLLSKTRAGTRGPQVSQEVSSLVRDVRFDFRSPQGARVALATAKGIPDEDAVLAGDGPVGADLVSTTERGFSPLPLTSGIFAATAVAGVVVAGLAGAVALQSFSPVLAYNDAHAQMTAASEAGDLSAYDAAFADGQRARVGWEQSATLFYAGASVGALALTAALASTVGAGVTVGWMLADSE